MNEIETIVEGQTEQAFVRDLLAAHLGSCGLAIWAVLSGRARRQGGVRKWESARNDIIRSLKGGRYCTTMFDFYAMPQDWPGRMEAAQLPWDQRGDHVEAAILKDVAEHMREGFNPTQFIPYVQVHEFEALVFSDVYKLGEVCAPVAGPFASPTSLASQFQEVLQAAGDAEAINDGYDTCPSRQIMSLARGYRKALHGPIAAQRMGLEVLRSKCRHFAAWVAKLEKLRAGQ